MARQVAIAIGVARSGSLVLLPGARTGAKDFAKWAKGQGFEVVELTDEAGPVTAAAIKTAVAAAVNAKDVQRLFIFFAGHGVAKGVDVEFWLLSKADEDADECVNVAGSLALARRSGIRHIAFFGDACRVMAGKDQDGIYGSVIFPPGRPSRTPVELDQFYAARGGEAALEARPKDSDLEAAFGIFTGCLLEILRGRNPKAIENVLLDGSAVRAVTAKSLADHVVDAVQDKLEALKRPEVQTPDPRPGSYPPNVLAKITAGPPRVVVLEPTYFPIEGSALASTDFAAGEAPLARPPGSARTGPGRTLRVKPREIRGGPVVLTGTRPTSKVSKNRPPVANRHLAAPLPSFDEATLARIETFTSEAGREHFESRSGLSVVGSKIRGVHVAGAALDVFLEEKAWHVRGPDPTAKDWRRGRRGVSAVLELGKGFFAASAIFPGFIGTMVVGERGVSHVAYLPAGNSVWGRRPEARSEGVRRSLARAAAAAQQGRFDQALQLGEDLAQSLDRFEQVNPTLALLMAYGWDQQGRWKKIVELVRRFERLEQTVPYDLFLLSGLVPRQISRPIRPVYPLLTQGWAYLETEGLHPALAEARRSLAPTLWATPTGAGGRALAAAVVKGELR